MSAIDRHPAEHHVGFGRRRGLARLQFVAHDPIIGLCI